MGSLTTIPRPYIRHNCQMDLVSRQSPEKRTQHALSSCCVDLPSSRDMPCSCLDAGTVSLPVAAVWSRHVTQLAACWCTNPLQNIHPASKCTAAAPTQVSGQAGDARAPMYHMCHIRLYNLTDEKGPLSGVGLTEPATRCPACHQAAVVHCRRHSLDTSVVCACAGTTAVGIGCARNNVIDGNAACGQPTVNGSHTRLLHAALQSWTRAPYLV